MLLRPQRSHARLTNAWTGVIVSTALLLAGGWTIRRAHLGTLDPSIMLVDFLGVFVILAGMEFVAFTVIGVLPLRAGRRERRR